RSRRPRCRSRGWTSATSRSTTCATRSRGSRPTSSPSPTDPMRGSIAVVALLAAAAGGCGDNPPAPPPPAHIVSGGGIADGPLRGSLNVYVIDEDTRAGISSATRRLGPGDEQEPCEQLTDSTGLAAFASKDCKLLTKPATLTISASGH